MTNSQHVMAWRYRTKLKLVTGFGGSCGICGYNKTIAVLHFHHLDPKTKLFGLGHAKPRAWSKIVEEALKCVMLCSNCHGEVHAGVTQIPDNIPRLNVEAAGAALPMRRKVVRKTTNKHAPRPSREKVPNRPRGKSLRDLVLATSRVAVAKKFGVTETAVRKWLVVDSQRGLASKHTKECVLISQTSAE